MKMKQCALGLLLAAATATQAMAQSASTPPYTPQVGPRPGDFELLLTGSGTSTNNFDNNTFGTTGSLGYFLTDSWLAGFRQTLGFGLADDSRDVWNGQSVVFIQYNLNLGRWRPYIGAFIGGVYGKGVEDDGVGGLEGGLKWYANESTFLYGGASYGPTFTEGFDEGVLQYAVGIGFNF